MSAVFYILLGWLLTILAAWGWGWLPLRALRIEGEARSLALYRFILGAGLLSLLVFLLCVAGLVYKGAIYALLLAGVLLLYWKRPLPFSIPWDRSGWLYAGFGLYYFMYALMPEMSPDGMSYHLGLVSRYYREHGFRPLPTNMYASLSQAMEMLFLAAFSIGRHSAAALVHFTFLLLLPCALGIHAGRAGWRAGLFVFLLPLVAIDGVSAYNDVALALVAVLIMDAMSRGWVGAAALLAGFAFSIKYTGAVFALLLLPAWRHFPHWIWGLALSLPWLVKNYFDCGNPLAPFFNAWFPNPWYSVEFESGYRAFLRHYDVSGRREWLREVFLGGPKLSGFLGPAALLLPVGLFGLKDPRRRWWLAAAGCALIVYPLNIGTRFLIPALPFLALGLFTWLGPRAPWALTAAVVCAWPTVQRAYSSPHTWRFDSISLRAALRLETEDAFLVRKRAGYVTARTIETFVPPGESVFAASPVAESYTGRNIIVGYQSTQGQRLQHALAAHRHQGYQAGFLYLCPGNRLEVETDTSDTWSITEIEPKPAAMRCNRQPSSAALALDSLWTSRWRTWGPARQGDYCELDGSGPWKVWATADQWALRLKGCRFEPSQSPPVDYRADARRYFLSAGVRYLAVDQVDYPSADMRERPDAWGLELLAERGAVRLYRWKNEE